MKSMRVKQGKYQWVNVTYRNNGTSIVTPLSEWIPIPAGATLSDLHKMIVGEKA